MDLARQGLSFTVGGSWSLPSPSVCPDAALLDVFGPRRANGADGRTLRIIHKDEPLPDGWHPDRDRAPRIWYHQDAPDVVIEFGNDDHEARDYVRLHMLVFALCEPALAAGGVLVHGALLERDGRGVVLAGPGGTGKSTCYRRARPPWRGVSDDMTLVCPTGEGGYAAHPMPTVSEFLHGNSDLRWDVQRSVALGAVFFLEQAPVDEAERLADAVAALLLHKRSREVYQAQLRRRRPELALPRQEQILSNVCAAARVVPGFRLRFTRDGRFLEAIETALEGNT